MAVPLRGGEVKAVPLRKKGLNGNAIKKKTFFAKNFDS